MAVLSKDTSVGIVPDTDLILHPKAAVADTFYVGGMVYNTTAGAGGITPVAAAGLTFLGFCVEQKVAATTDRVKVSYGGIVEWPITAAATDVGKYVFSEVAEGSDNPADCAIFATGAAAAAGDICCGLIIDVVNSKPIVDTKQRAVDIVGT